MASSWAPGGRRGERDLGRTEIPAERSAAASFAAASLAGSEAKLVPRESL